MMAKPRSKSELQEQLKIQRQLRDELFIESRQLARKLSELQLNENAQEHELYLELARAIRDRELVEIRIAGILIRQDTLPAAESEKRGRTDRQRREEDHWYHSSPPEENDPKFKYPLMNENREILDVSKKDLARWIDITEPTLEKRNEMGLIHVCKSIKKGFRVWFTSKEIRAGVTAAMLKEKRTRPR